MGIKLEDRGVWTIFIFIALVLFSILSIASSCFIVEQVQQAIVLQFGEVVSKQPLGPGLHFKIPLIQDVVYFDNRILNIETERREVIAEDQKRLTLDVYAKYKIQDPLIFLQSVRSEHNLRNRMASVIESIARQEVSKVTLNCLLSDCRRTVSTNIENLTKLRAISFGIEIIDVRIRRIDLPAKNTEAIFQRMQTEREKEAREIRAFGFEEERKIKSEADKNKTILLASAHEQSERIRGEGEAKAFHIYSEAFKADPEFFRFYYHMRMYKSIASDKNTSIVLGSDNELLKYLFKKKGE